MKKPRRSVIKDKKLGGEWAESVFMARPGKHGPPVSRPWGEMHPYDFVIGNTGRFASIQFKSTMQEAEGGYLCTLRTGDRNYAPDSFDFPAAYLVLEDIWYIIPPCKNRRPKEHRAPSQLRRHKVRKVLRGVAFVARGLGVERTWESGRP